MSLADICGAVEVSEVEAFEFFIMEARALGHQLKGVGDVKQSLALQEQFRGMLKTRLVHDDTRDAGNPELAEATRIFSRCSDADATLPVS